MSASISISTGARDFLLRTRPELVGDFELIGDQSLIPVHKLLRPAANPPREQFEGRSELPTFNVERSTLNVQPGLGDRIAAVLRGLGIERLLWRLELLKGCGCAGRQARLNALTPQLRGLLEPWPMTLAVLLSWLLFVVALLAR